MITLEFQGLGALQAKLANLSPELRAGVASAVAETTMALHGDIVRRVSQPGTGRVYRRRGVAHQASAPGQPPAVDTGKYRASIQPDLSAVQAQLEGRVGTNDKRGVWLEYGTRRMAARPHFGPAAQAQASDFVARVREALNRTVR